MAKTSIRRARNNGETSADVGARAFCTREATLTITVNVARVACFAAFARDRIATRVSRPREDCARRTVARVDQRLRILINQRAETLRAAKCIATSIA
jgi:hypothetical protein